MDYKPNLNRTETVDMHFQKGIGLSTVLLIQVLDERAGKQFRHQKEGDAGLDIEVWNPDTKVNGVWIPSGLFTRVPSGLKVKLGDNSWGMVRPRSSTFFGKGLFVMEGSIDSGYTGELFVNVFNPNPTNIFVENGTRLAQLIPVPMFSFIRQEYVDQLPNTERGESGFGSTGK